MTRDDFAGRYNTEKIILGSGSYGSVFKMYDRITDRYDAIKYIKKEDLWSDMKTRVNIDNKTNIFLHKH